MIKEGMLRKVDNMIKGALLKVNNLYKVYYVNYM